ncbi:MAG TPA: ATP synthase F0 subunit B [Planctomycetota bacterium]|nr:ATP synthase F0 subunit B [Planctomycetota bacterium]
MSPTTMAALTPGSMFFVQILGFVILVGVLLKLAVPVLGKVLGARSKEIEETFQKIDLDTQDASKKLAEMKEKVARLTEESKRRLDAALADATQTKARMMEESAKQVEAAFAKATSEIEIEREKAVLELRQEATALTLRAAEHLIQATMNDQVHEQLMSKYVVQLGMVKRP